MQTLLECQSLQDSWLLICPWLMCDGSILEAGLCQSWERTALLAAGCCKLGWSDGYILLHFSVRAFVQTYSLF